MAAEETARRILLFGAHGQVGGALASALSPLGTVIALDRASADFSVPATLPPIVRHYQPHVIVNAAAYSAVDRAESEAATAEMVNHEAPRVLAAEAAAMGALMVHFSSDYVFDGKQSTPYVETDEPHPLSVYGRSKFAGERGVAESGAKYLTLRTSWVFAASGKNFLNTILRLAAERETLRVVADQHGAPTPASLVADVTVLLLRAMLDADADDPRWGLYHVSAAGETSWHGYAAYVIARGHSMGLALKATPQTIVPIPSNEYPTPATRPASSRLDTAKLRSTFDVQLPDWKVGVDRVLDHLASPPER